ncbi:MAG: tRNA (adenosine(37)-N6)-threonylcarbamoyltransferase complex dimerization subunit type 1 TsaB [Mariprofundaceae bacterium]|nr:tRNA (adenosine(37)-N6)-threonylcarbamoyltransferase complex dimerization subunit type 1 TsaB [Mariprofundaceae bacterium]
MGSEKRNILGLDIAYGAACACLIRLDGKCFTRQGDTKQPHSQVIIPLLHSLLEEAGMDWPDLDMLALGIGPGSFTGLRIATATMAGINSGLNLPLLEISSLAVTATQADTQEPLFVIEDARSGLAYYGHYQEGEALSDDCCRTWEDMLQLEPGMYTSVNPCEDHLPDWPRVKPRLSRPEAMLSIIERSSRAIHNTEGMTRSAVPAYLIASQAERNDSKP